MLAALGIFGASLFFGDSMITPAISVLSAVEGVKVVAAVAGAPGRPDHRGDHRRPVPGSSGWARRRWGGCSGRSCSSGSSASARAASRGIAEHPEILKALSPTYAARLPGRPLRDRFFALAAVVLAVTGAEALYADMGHFGRAPIRRAWLLLVFPACILSYMGQGALILGRPDGNISSPFFLLVPDWARLPMVFLATAATVIASQAVITGAFSVAHQAAQLGYLPRLRIAHTSEETAGQIYVPWINWLLLVVGAHARAHVPESRPRWPSPTAWR